MLNDDLYLDFVIQEAIKNGKFFMLDSGEGNGFIDSDTGWYIEDLSGWYIDFNDIEKLSTSKKNGTAYYEFADSYVFVKWKKSSNKGIKISFEKY